jgi:hypothetical protein
MKVKIECSHAEVELYEAARAIAELDSISQNKFFTELFEVMESNCGSAAKYESQLCWIGTGASSKVIDAFERMIYFSEAQEKSLNV